MALTLGMTGMDGRTQQALMDAFNAANAATGHRFSLTSDKDAKFVVVDMDSLYGPMSWMQLHSAGKHVIGFTQSPRVQTDSRLGRPLDPVEFQNLLATLAEGVPVVKRVPEPGSEASASAPADVAAPAPPPVAAPVAALHPGAPAGATPAPAPDMVLPEEHATAVPVTPVEAPAPTPVNVAPEPPRARTLADWLVRGALSTPVKFARNGGPDLVIDPERREYHGPALLKPLAGYFEGTVESSDFQPASAADLAASSAQPLQRLVWLAGLMEGKGTLATGLGEHIEYVLTKWPQTEREYPKHFRIATAMMKGPARLMEIAEVASVPVEDVADFINANIATGFAQASVSGAQLPVEGLLGRLREG